MVEDAAEHIAPADNYGPVEGEGKDAAAAPNALLLTGKGAWLGTLQLSSVVIAP